MPDAIRHRRRDLKRLVALESLHLATGVGALLAIAIRSIVVATDLAVAVSTTSVVLLALTYLLLALRIRAGQEGLRRELRALEHRQGLDATRTVEPSSHPYRSPAVCPCGLSPGRERSPRARDEMHHQRW